MDRYDFTSIHRITEIPLLPDWQRLFDVAADERIRWNLNRLAKFCSASGIRPDAVNEAVVAQFQAALEAESFVKDPAEWARNSIVTWNRAVDEVPGWPQRKLHRQSRRRDYALPLVAFPQSFQDDVARWQSRVDGSDPLAEDGPDRPFSPATTAHRLQQIRRFATGLVEQGHRPEDIVDLAYLVHPDHFLEALRFQLTRNDGKASGAIHGMAMALKSIARHHVKVDEAVLAELKAICGRLKPARQGLSDKNRACLRQFDQPENVAKLLLLPGRLISRAKARGQPDRKAALLVQTALAIELLLMCPIRRRNLANLNVDRHLHWTRSAREAACHLAIPAEEVKNQVPIEFELPPEATRILRLYLDRYRPLLAGNTCPWLFPGRDGAGHKVLHALSSQISGAIFRETGLKVHVHQFRHFAAKLHLDHRPGEYELVRRLLSHKSIDTTTRAYTGLETASAVRHYDQKIIELREALELRGRRRRRRARDEGDDKE
jgi:integrase